MVVVRARADVVIGDWVGRVWFSGYKAEARPVGKGCSDGHTPYRQHGCYVWISSYIPYHYPMTHVRIRSLSATYQSNPPQTQQTTPLIQNYIQHHHPYPVTISPHTPRGRRTPQSRDRTSRSKRRIKARPSRTSRRILPRQARSRAETHDR